MLLRVLTVDGGDYANEAPSWGWAKLKEMTKGCAKVRVRVRACVTYITQEYSVAPLAGMNTPAG